MLSLGRDDDLGALLLAADAEPLLAHGLLAAPLRALTLFDEGFMCAAPLLPFLGCAEDARGYRRSQTLPEVGRDEVDRRGPLHLRPLELAAY